MIQDQFLLVSINLLHLAQYHVPFAIDGIRIEFRIQEYVRQYVHGAMNVLVEYLREVHRLFPTGIRVEVSTHILDLDLEFVLRAAGRALECHVFEEVRRSVVTTRLVSGSGVDPYADRGGVRAGHGFRRDAQSRIGEGRYFGRGSREEVGREGMSEVGIGIGMTIAGAGAGTGTGRG